MHPAERLRFVARSSGAPQPMLVEEAAAGLVSFIDNSGALVMACRRVLARQTTSGPLVWLAAHILASPDPRAAARDCVERITIDRTARRLANWLPRDATVCVLGWPDVASAALAQRPDIHVLAVDVHGEGSGLVHWLEAQDLDADDVPTGGLGAAVISADVVVIEASAIGPSHAVAVAGSLAAAAVARTVDEVRCVLVGGVGRLLPARMFEGVERRITDQRAPWYADDELVPLALFGGIAHDGGVDEVAVALRQTDCPVVAELFGGNDGIAI
jgi:hypothetical protein